MSSKTKQIISWALLIHSFEYICAVKSYLNAFKKKYPYKSHATALCQKQRQ